jgi:hypothetical protein
VHPHEPDTAYVVPIHQRLYHYPPDGRLRVYRPAPSGGEWEPLTDGLPPAALLRQRAARRDGGRLAGRSPGIYFGTTGGQVYGSADAGDSWTPIVRDLPAVLSVEVQTLP